MYLGRIVEIGPSAAIYEDPKHPYTKALLRAIPEPDPRRSVPRDLPRGEVPDAARPPLGCSFHPRCPVAFEVCGWEARDLRDLLEARWALQAESSTRPSARSSAICRCSKRQRRARGCGRAETKVRAVSPTSSSQRAPTTPATPFGAACAALFRQTATLISNGSSRWRRGRSTWVTLGWSVISSTMRPSRRPRGAGPR